MKPSLQFRLSQHLTLTPQLQQSIRLLQLSTVELNQEIDRMLMDNPALEREDADGGGHEPPPASQLQGGTSSSSAPAEAAPAETDWSADIASSWRGAPDDEEDGDRSFATPDTPTLRDHLLSQLTLTNLDERDRVFVMVLIDALDEDGYLTQPLEEIAALLPPEVEAGMEELAIALRHLQHFEPAGVGARSPGECLCLQLKALPDDPVRRLAVEIAEKHLDLLANRDYTRLKNVTGASEETLRAAQRLIQSLNPRPGASFAKLETRYVIPDVIVKKSRNVWRASLNPDAMPRLRINRLYAELAAGARAGGAGISSQLQEARWLIKNVQQRFDTILRVSQAIVERQRHFLEHGEVAMRPLVLREIAETLSLHESTISRVTTQKFMATPRGTFELKYFFGSHVATEAGGAASSTAIRALIKQLVSAEDAKAPLSDARISQILGEQGIVVARRTIAKYRESLQIPPVNQRKAL
ncbi:MAG TPA: RNA polymerase factor sigma-54 [Burkholderiales bacterium]|jgi:RNA polymerase sigma-54 factor|nr:RNA polymerase factor sigma-54 [Burkholderiales bacterium]